MTSRLLRASEALPRLGRAPDRLDRPAVRRHPPPLRTLAARQPELPAGDHGIRRDHPRQHLLPVRQRDERTGARGGSGRHHHVCRPPPPNSTLQQRSSTIAQIYDDLRQLPRERSRLPARHAWPEHRGHGAETVGSPHAHHRAVAAARAAERGEDRRRAGRGVPAAAAARHSGPADPVHHRQHRSVLAPERRGAEIPAGRAGERTVHLPRHRSEDRQAANGGGDRSQQDCLARPQDERCRQRADRDAGRRLRELLRPRRTLLQGDSRRCSNATGSTPISC